MMKRHSNAEKSVAWNQAREMMARGKSQSDICKALGISVMTFHRWRKKLGDPSQKIARLNALPEGDGADQIALLRQENERLRKIVTDLLLEKAKLEEAASNRSAAR